MSTTPISNIDIKFSLHVKAVLFLIVSLVIQGNLSAQLSCGTQEPTTAEVKYTLEVIDQIAVQRSSAMKWMPIRVHRLASNNGSGAISTSDINQAIATLNRKFAAINVSWYIADMQTIPSNKYHNLNLDTERLGLIQEYVTPDAVNIFFANELEKSGNGLCGYASYPSDNVASLAVFASNSCTNNLATANLAHEFGHFFNLFHTFRGTSNSNIDQHAEHVPRSGDQANCAHTGDLLCDTDADPLCSMSTNCEYVGDEYDQYGNKYVPPIGNIMTYYNKSCGAEFSGMQLTRMEQALQIRLQHTAYDLQGAAYNQVNNPSELKASIGGNYGIALQWKDNANNETGYFIERSKDYGQTFLPITQGGVGENEHTFVDYSAKADIDYIYRIKASNDEPEDYIASNVIKKEFDYCLPDYESFSCNILGIGAGIDYVGLGASASLIDNESTCQGSYSVYSGDSVKASLSAGSTIPFEISLVNKEEQYLQQNLSIWIDLNQNNRFDNDNELLYQSDFGLFGPQDISGELTIPSCALSGSTVMRFRTTYLPEGVVADACSYYNYGEVEDYQIEITGVQLNQASINISEYSGSQFNDGIICGGSSATLIASGGVNYYWEDGSEGQIRTVSETGTYTVTAVDNTGCEHTVSTTIYSYNNAEVGLVVLDDQEFGFKEGKTICQGEEVTIEAKGGVSYLWSNGSDNQARTISESGVYSVDITTPEGCIINRAFELLVRALPEVKIDAVTQAGQEVYDGILLYGDTAVLSATGASEYMWSTGSTQQTIEINQDGNYSVVGIDEYGCSQEASTNLYFSIILSSHAIALDVVANQENNEITWVYDQDINADHYRIERKTTGQEFELVERIVAFKDSDNPIYSAFDLDVAAGGDYYYRVIAELNNIDKSVSDLVHLYRANQSATSINVSVYPNPARHNITVEHGFDLNDAHPISITINNELGEEVLKLQGIQSAQEKIDLAQFTPGVYFIRTAMGSQSKMQKLLISGEL